MGRVGKSLSHPDCPESSFPQSLLDWMMSSTIQKGCTVSVTEVTQERSSFPSARAGWLAIVLAVVLAVALGWWLLSVVIRLFRPSPTSSAVPRDEVGDFLSVFVPQSSPTAVRSTGPRCAEGAGKLIAAIPDLGGWGDAHLSDR